jgi:hypothetical protein
LNPSQDAVHLILQTSYLASILLAYVLYRSVAKHGFCGRKAILAHEHFMFDLFGESNDSVRQVFKRIFRALSVAILVQALKLCLGSIRIRRRL